MRAPTKSSVSDRQKTLGVLGWGQVVSLKAKQKDLAVRTTGYALSKGYFIFVSVSACDTCWEVERSKALNLERGHSKASEKRPT